MNEDDVELQTVDHRARTATLFGAFAWAILAAVFWVTSTPKRWIALVVAVVCGVGLYLALR